MASVTTDLRILGLQAAGKIIPVDWLVGDTLETCRYRSCDCCDGREFRRFYQTTDDELSVCEHCIAGLEFQPLAR